MTNREWAIRIIKAVVNFSDPEPPESIIKLVLPHVEAFRDEAFQEGWHDCYKGDD